MTDHITAAIDYANQGDLDAAYTELLAVHEAGESDERLLELAESMHAATREPEEASHV